MKPLDTQPFSPNHEARDPLSSLLSHRLLGADEERSHAAAIRNAATEWLDALAAHPGTPLWLGHMAARIEAGEVLFSSGEFRLREASHSPDGKRLRDDSEYIKSVAACAAISHQDHSESTHLVRRCLEELKLSDTTLRRLNASLAQPEQWCAADHHDLFHSSTSIITLARATAAAEQFLQHTNVLVESNMKLVLSVAKSARQSLSVRTGDHRIVPMEDLLTAGILGLRTAALRFDPARGFRFSTFATWWIKQSVGRALRKESSVVRLPSHVWDLVSKVHKFERSFVAEHGREPSDREILQGMKISPAKLDIVRQVGLPPIEFDAPIGNRGSAPLLDAIEDPSSLKDTSGTPERVGEILHAIEQLTPHESAVVRARYLADPHGRPADREDIAEELGIPLQQVTRLERAAIRKLRGILLST